MEGLGGPLELDDHSRRVARFAELTATELGLPDQISERIRLAGLLHDIGKSELPAEILDRHALFDDVRGWVLGHHEGVDVPAIPIGARIIAVADRYETMTSDRPHRRALDHESAAEELRACAGSQFDAEVVEAFLGVLQRARAGTLVGVAA
jgi:putative nucleotidyltransferase with HDIG domain